MTTKTDYTEQEWDGLIRSTLDAGMYVVISDMSLIGWLGELKELSKAIQSIEPEPPAKELVGSLVADLAARSAKGEKMEPTSKGDDDAKAQLLEQLKADIAILDTKADPAERAAFRGWLLALAQATAEAGREGGVLGIGSVRVSDKEKAALATLAEVLGTA